VAKDGRVGKGIAAKYPSDPRRTRHDLRRSLGTPRRGATCQSSSASPGNAPRRPGKLGDVAFCWLVLRPLCWGGPRRQAPRETAAKAAEPPSSSGLGHRPFKAAARVRIPLGAPAGISWQTQGPVEQLGVLATLSRWRSRVQIPSGPLWGERRYRQPLRSGSSVGTSVRLKSGRSAVRPRP
jgi:hypothetical protein